MSPQPTFRGGAPVGQVAHMDRLEAASVLYLRLWCDGARGRQVVRDDFATALGPDHGTATSDAWETLMELCADHCPHPLMRHAVACKCLGANESCIANFITTAAKGAREEAVWPRNARRLLRPATWPGALPRRKHFTKGLNCL